MRKIGELNSSNDQPFDMYLQGALVNRTRLYFRPTGHDTFRKDRVTFFGTPEAFLFSGILLSDEHRGLGLSQDFIRAFTALSEEMQVKFDQTCVIRKPIIAKVLKNMGAEASNTEKEIEILTPSSADTTPLPNIAALSKGAKSLKGESGKFFNFVSPQERSHYPATSPDRDHVHLHARYSLERHENPSTAVVEVSRRVLDSI